MREKELEADLLTLSERCSLLQGQLDEEKAKVSALMTTNSASSTLQAAQEVRLIQEKLKKKEKDWQAVILKMNELHLSSKDARDKVDNRNQHVIYLETTLAESQRQHALLVASIEASDSGLRRECASLREQAEGTHIPLWQYEEVGSEVPPLSSRVVLPFCTTREGLLTTAIKRLSNNEHESWVDTYFTPKMAAIPPVEGSAGWIAYPPTIRDPVSKVESLLFMDDDDRKVTQSAETVDGATGNDELRLSNHYNNLVDAYNNVTESRTTESFDYSGTERRVSSELDRSQRATDQTTAPNTLDISTHSVPLSQTAETGQGVATAKELVGAKVEEKPKPPTNSIIERLKAKAEAAEAAASKEGGDDDNVPEWKRKFMTIGAKNAKEEVLETQGAGGVKEYGRTSWEALKNNDRKATPAVDLFSQQKVKWTPRVKHGSDSDSDDDRYPGYSPYIGGAPVTLPSGSDSDNDDDDATPANTHNESEAEADTQRDVVSSAPMSSRKGSDSDSDSSDEEMKPIVQTTAPPVAPPAAKSKADSDSGSSSDVDSKKRSAVTRPPIARKKGSDSDSDSSQEAKPAQPSEPAAAPPAISARMGSDSDSDSSEDTKPKLTVAPTPAAKSSATDSDSDSSEDEKPRAVPPVQKPPVRKDDSDSDSDSSDDDKSKQRQAPAPPVPSKIAADSDSDSSQDSPPAPAKLEPAPINKPAKAAGSDSDSDSSEDSPRKKPAARMPPPRKADSDSDSDSSDEDTKPKSAPPHKPVVAAKPPPKKNDSDSDSDSSEDSKPAKKPAPAPPKPQEPEDDGFGGWSKPAQKSIGGAKPKPTANDSDSDDSKRQSPVRTASSNLSRTVLTKKTQSESDSKDKQMFVIMNGKLVKSYSRSDLMAETTDIAATKPKKSKTGKKSESGATKKSASATAAKPAFLIVDGKLVKSDGGADKKTTKKKVTGDKKKKKGAS